MATVRSPCRTKAIQRRIQEFYSTDEPLVAHDSDLVRDVYQRFDGVTTLLTPGNGAFDVDYEGSADDGSAVFYETAEPVIADDTDAVEDVYGAYLAP